MILYLQKVRNLLKKLVLVQVRHVPRAENSRADALVKLATALQEDLSRLTLVEYLAEPSIYLCDVEVSQVGSEPSWMDPIWDYIINERLPDDPKEAAKIRTRSARFTNHKGSPNDIGVFNFKDGCVRRHYTLAHSQRLYRQSASTPGAQQLTLTNSSTLHKSRNLRSQISSGYIATRP